MPDTTLDTASGLAASTAAPVAPESTPSTTAPSELMDESSSSLQQSSRPDSLPAGGVDGDRFDWREVWHPIAYVDDLSTSQLTRFTLLETDLVIWWDADAQTWRVFEDRCPHRLAPLSEGRINESGQLECPYHGWAFDGTGACQAIPQLPEESEAAQSERACAASLPTQVRQGLLFVYPGAAEHAARVPVPTVPALDESDDRWVCLNTFRDLPYDALTLLENVIDASHVPFTHHKSVSDRANGAPMDLQVTESNRQGFTGVWPEGPRRGKLGQQDTTFIAPNLMWHDLTSEQFGRTLTVVYATPIRKGECRLFARFPFKFSSPIPRLVMKLFPRWYNHLGQNGVLEDDQVFLHLQERALEQSGGSDRFAQAFYLPTRADAFVTELRKWVNRYGADPFPESSLPPAQSTEQLLDRYHSHTQHCQYCQGALKTIQRGRWAAIALAVILWAIAPVLAVSLDTWMVIAASIFTLALGGIWVALGRLEQQFYQGRPVPPRNQN